MSHEHMIYVWYIPAIANPVKMAFVGLSKKNIYKF